MADVEDRVAENGDEEINRQVADSGDDDATVFQDSTFGHLQGPEETYCKVLDFEKDDDDFDGSTFGDLEGNFHDGYEIFQQEMESEKKDREKERNEFLAREQRANQTIDQLTEEMATKDQAMAAMEEKLRAEKVAALDDLRDEMQKERIEAVKENDDQRLRETEALQQKVDDLREELRSTKEASRREIERRGQEMTAAKQEEVTRKVGEVEERLNSQHDEECRRLKDRYKELDDRYKDDMKKLTEAKEELEGILRRTVEASPNDTLRHAIESVTNHEKKAEENWERQRKKYEDDIQQLRKDLKETRQSQNDKMKEKYEGKIGDLRQENEGLNATIDGMKKEQQADSDVFERKKKSWLQTLYQSRAKIAELQRSLEAKNATCQQLTEKVGDVKAELEKEKMEAKSRMENIERQHGLMTDMLKDQIADLKQKLTESNTENAGLNEKILNEVKNAKDEAKDISDQHQREITRLTDGHAKTLQTELNRCKQELEATHRAYCETLIQKHVQQEKDLERKIEGFEDQLELKDDRIKELEDAMDASSVSSREKKHSGGLLCSMRNGRHRDRASTCDTESLMQSKK